MIGGDWGVLRNPFFTAAFTADAVEHGFLLVGISVDTFQADNPLPLTSPASRTFHGYMIAQAPKIEATSITDTHGRLPHD